MRKIESQQVDGLCSHSESTRPPNFPHNQNILPRSIQPCYAYSLEKKRFRKQKFCQLMQIHGIFAETHTHTQSFATLLYSIYHHRQRVPSHYSVEIQLSSLRVSTYVIFVFNNLPKPSCIIMF